MIFHFPKNYFVKNKSCFKSRRRSSVNLFLSFPSDWIMFDFFQFIFQKIHFSLLMQSFDKWIHGHEKGLVKGLFWSIESKTEDASWFPVWIDFWKFWFQHDPKFSFIISRLTESNGQDLIPVMINSGYNQILMTVIYVTLSNMTSAAPLSLVLSLFSKRKEGKKRAQRRSGLKGLQRLLISD